MDVNQLSVVRRVTIKPAVVYALLDFERRERERDDLYTVAHQAWIEWEFSFRVPVLGLYI